MCVENPKLSLSPPNSPLGFFAKLSFFQEEEEEEIEHK